MCLWRTFLSHDRHSGDWNRELGTQSVIVYERHTRMVRVIRWSQDDIQTNECDFEVFAESGKQTGFVIEGQTANGTNSHPAMALLHP